MKGIADIFRFDDMTIVTIKTDSLFSVYKDMGDCLIYVFYVLASCADQIDIEALHANGYFDSIGTFDNTYDLDDILEEMASVKAYLKQTSGGWPHCIDDAINILREKKYMETTNPAIEEMRKLLDECIEEAKRGEE